MDWYDGSGLAAQTPLDPYRVPAYINPPWFALGLSPLALLPARLGQALNAYLNLGVTALVVARHGGGRWSLLLALTSLPVAALILNGNTEWIPMAAFLLPPSWALPLLLTKPQTGGLAALVWLKEAADKVRFVLPVTSVMILSLVIWPGWPWSMLVNIAGRSADEFSAGPNASLWPWSIPLGLALIVVAWRREDEATAVGATLCLAPYFVVHSVTLFFAMLAARHPRAAAIAWAALWALALGKGWRLLAG